jgi:hypothetical protein
MQGVDKPVTRGERYLYAIISRLDEILEILKPKPVVVSNTKSAETFNIDLNLFNVDFDKMDKQQLIEYAEKNDIKIDKRLGEDKIRKILKG